MDNYICWYTLCIFGIFCGHLVYFVVIWNIWGSFGIFCGPLVHCFPFWYSGIRRISNQLELDPQIENGCADRGASSFFP
jgi:hypothetical protein